jgi:hypothetical protein
MANVTFEDNSMQVKAALNEAVTAFLYEASEELRSQAAKNSRVDSGQLKSSWSYAVDEEAGEAQIGSPLENAIWEEFGTGEYALNGDGRKNLPWVYQDGKGEFHTTSGKKPNRTLFNAYNTLKDALIKRAESIFKERMK